MDRIDTEFGHMKIFSVTCFLAACVFSYGAQAQQYELGSTYVLVDILPQDGVELAKRADSCVHWQGEEGLDNERKQQIQQALIQFRCRDLLNDHKKMTIKYKNDATLIKALEYLKKYYIK